MLLSMVKWVPPPHSPRKPKTFSVQIRCAPLKIARITLKLSRSLRQVKGFWLTHTTFAYSLSQAYCFPELSLGGFIFGVSNTPTNLTMSGSKIWIYSHTKNVSNYCVVSTFKQTKNEDDQQLRWPKMKTTNKSTAMLVYVRFAAFFTKRNTWARVNRYFFLIYHWCCVESLKVPKFRFVAPPWKLLGSLWNWVEVSDKPRDFDYRIQLLHTRFR